MHCVATSRALLKDFPNLVFVSLRSRACRDRLIRIPQIFTSLSGLERYPALAGSAQEGLQSVRGTEPISCARNAMNTTIASFLVFVFSASALVFSQDQGAIRAAEAACGPKNVKFDAKQDATQHPVPQPAPDQANLY